MRWRTRPTGKVVELIHDRLPRLLRSRLLDQASLTTLLALRARRTVAVPDERVRHAFLLGNLPLQIVELNGIRVVPGVLKRELLIHVHAIALFEHVQVCCVVQRRRAWGRGCCGGCFDFSQVGRRRCATTLPADRVPHSRHEDNCDNACCNHRQARRRRAAPTRRHKRRAIHRIFRKELLFLRARPYRLLGSNLASQDLRVLRARVRLWT